VRKLICSLAAAVSAAGSPAACAGWSASLDAEHFRWEEATSPTVSESGPRYGLSLEYEQLRPAGWQFAYRGQLRNGTVDYTGTFLFTGGPATARTEYTGLVNEAQGIYRLASMPLELVSGIGWDYWERNILPDQKEHYSILFLRLGANVDTRNAQGWFGGAGLKLPFLVSEDAHLDELGFDRNPRLEPKGEPSFYAQAGYRFSRQWSFIGYYDSYRLGESKGVTTARADTPGTTFVVFQPASSVDTLGVRLRYSFP
jgi:hypothetical protein